MKSYCPECGELRDEQWQFCRGCGSRRPEVPEVGRRAFCTTCGEAVGLDWKHCRACGSATPVLSEDAESQPIAPTPHPSQPDAAQPRGGEPLEREFPTPPFGYRSSQAARKSRAEQAAFAEESIRRRFEAAASQVERAEVPSPEDAPPPLAPPVTAPRPTIELAAVPDLEPDPEPEPVDDATTEIALEIEPATSDEPWPVDDAETETLEREPPDWTEDDGWASVDANGDLVVDVQEAATRGAVDPDSSAEGSEGLGWSAAPSARGAAMEELEPRDLAGGHAEPAAALDQDGLDEDGLDEDGFDHDHIDRDDPAAVATHDSVGDADQEDDVIPPLPALPEFKQYPELEYPELAPADDDVVALISPQYDVVDIDGGVTEIAGSVTDEHPMVEAPPVTATPVDAGASPSVRTRLTERTVPTYRPLQTVASIAQIMWLTAGTSAVALAAGLVILNLRLEQFRRTGDFAPVEATSQIIDGWLTAVVVVAVIGALAATAWWTMRATDNIAAAADEPPKLTRLASVAAWVVPGLNLVAPPLQVHALDTERPTEAKRPTLWIAIWWLSLLGFLAGVLWVRTLPAGSVEQSLDANAYGALTYGLLIVSCLTAVGMVATTTSMLDDGS